MNAFDWQWFNASSPWIRSPMRGGVRLWNLFNRVSTEGHWWGFGLVQIGHRHLFYVGSGGVRVLFLGKPVVEP